MATIGIIHYGMGNITSVKNACEFLRIPHVIAEVPAQLASATHIIIPGVGAFAEGMRQLRDRGFLPSIHDAATEKKKPLLGICLGMQLFATTGEEGGETPGLDLIPGRVRRLPDTGLRIPHVGWNTVTPIRENPLLATPKDAYFVHSYYIEPVDPLTVAAKTEYGISFPSMIRLGHIFGTQFHPEKSHAAGLDILFQFSRISVC